MKKISMDKLKGVPKTLLIPLRGRYLETKRKDGIISDPKSIEMIDAIKHDFADEELPWAGQMLVSVRTEILDEAVVKFLWENPDSAVVNLGCGLDTRIHRVDNGKLLWYDLDLPECIKIREKFFQETPRHKFIAKSLLDFSWIDQIPKGRKTLFIAEGLLNYFPQKDVKKAVYAIRDNFPDSELIFEVHSLLIKKSRHKQKHIKHAYSHFKWGISNGKDLERWSHGIEFVDQHHFLDRHHKRWNALRPEHRKNKSFSRCS